MLCRITRSMIWLYWERCVQLWSRSLINARHVPYLGRSCKEQGNERGCRFESGMPPSECCWPLVVLPPFWHYFWKGNCMPMWIMIGCMLIYWWPDFAMSRSVFGHLWPFVGAAVPCAAPPCLVGATIRLCMSAYSTGFSVYKAAALHSWKPFCYPELVDALNGTWCCHWESDAELSTFIRSYNRSPTGMSVTSLFCLCYPWMSASA